MPFYLRGGVGPVRYSHRIGRSHRSKPPQRASAGTYVFAIGAALIVVGIERGWFLIALGCCVLLALIVAKVKR